MILNKMNNEATFLAPYKTMCLSPSERYVFLLVLFWLGFEGIQGSRMQWSGNNK